MPAASYFSADVLRYVAGMPCSVEETAEMEKTVEIRNYFFAYVCM